MTKTTTARRPRNVVAEGRESTATTTARKAARKTAPKADKAATVPGHPNVALVTGKGTTGRTIAAIQSANRGHDSVAVLNDGSGHICTKHLGAGVVVKAGLNWDTVNKEFLELQRKEAEARKAAPKGKAVLAKGTETESNCKKAAADQRKAAKPVKEAKADKKAERKAARAEKAAPKADDPRKITIVDKKFTYGGDGTARRKCWEACAKAKTVAEYLAAGGKAKYLPRWVSAGAIKLA